MSTDADGVKKNPWAVVVPMAVILFLLLGCFWALKNLQLQSCEIFSYLTLVYPLIFGTAGVVLGGQISVKGKFSEQLPWAISASAGVAAALVGYGIAATSGKPDCTKVATQYTLLITDLPAITDKPLNVVVPEYIGAARSRGDGSTKDLTVQFDGTHRFHVRFFIFRHAEENKYAYYSTCDITFEIQSTPTTGNPATIIMQNGGPHFAFDDHYVDRIAENRKNVGESKFDNTCLKTTTENGNGVLQATDGTFYVEVRATGTPKFTFIPDTIKQLAKANGAQQDPGVGAPSEHIAPRAAANIDKNINILVGGSPTKETHLADLSPLAPIASGTQKPISKADRQNILREIKRNTDSPAISARDTDAKIAAISCPTYDQTLVDRYIEGDDLTSEERKEIYKGWANHRCYVVLKIEQRSSTSAQRARAIKLLTFALANSDGRMWQPNGSTPRNFSDSPVQFQAKEANLIFDSIQSDDDLVRDMALKFVRTLPVDILEHKFKAGLGHIADISQPSRERLAIAASFLYYNRIVEYLNGDQKTFSENQRAAIRRTIEKEMKFALPWTTESLFVGDKRNAYRAMLYYAMGIVQHEKRLRSDLGQASFLEMLGALRATSYGYPTNYLHVAQALAFGEGNGQSAPILDKLKKAEWYAPATFFDGNDRAPHSAELFAGPGDFSKLDAPLKLDKNVRLLMQVGEWDLVHGNGKVGWMRRPQYTAAQ